jgi:hypothetical protein
LSSSGRLFNTACNEILTLPLDSDGLLDPGAPGVLGVFWAGCLDAICCSMTVLSSGGLLPKRFLKKSNIVVDEVAHCAGQCLKRPGSVGQVHQDGPANSVRRWVRLPTAFVCRCTIHVFKVRSLNRGMRGKNCAMKVAPCSLEIQPALSVLFGCH